MANACKKHAFIQLLALSATQFSFESFLVRRWYRQQLFWLNIRFSDDRVVSTIRSSQQMLKRTRIFGYKAHTHHSH